MLDQYRALDEITYVRSFERVRKEHAGMRLRSTLEVLNEAEQLRGRWVEALLKNLGKRQAKPVVFELPDFWQRIFR